MRAHLDTISSIAEGCGSTAWVSGVVHAHSWLLSHFPEQGQDDIYGADPDSVVAAVIGPRGSATRHADGSHTLSGFWPFASGNENASWLLLGAVVRDEKGDVVDEGDFAVPIVSDRAQGRLVRQRAHRHGFVLGERREPRHPGPPIPVAARADHG